MIVKLLTEHHFEFLSLKEGCTHSSESTVPIFYIVRNHKSLNMCFYYMPINDTTFELSVFWPSDTEIMSCVKIGKI